MRQKALEKLGETSKRKREKEGGDGKAKKTRKAQVIPLSTSGKRVSRR